jgi:hypothetical protein
MRVATGRLKNAQSRSQHSERIGSSGAQRVGDVRAARRVAPVEQGALDSRPADPKRNVLEDRGREEKKQVAVRLLLEKGAAGLIHPVLDPADSGKRFYASGNPVDDRTGAGDRDGSIGLEHDHDPVGAARYARAE